MVGFNVELYKIRNIMVEKNILIILGVFIINMVIDDLQVYGGYVDNLVVGFFVCVNWSYKDCYMFEVNG